MTAIRKLLVANRGEIAERVIATAHAMGIGTVAVFSDADAHHPHVDAADEAVRLPGVSPAETYLRGDLIVSAARATGCDAVHPGYGFLSENAGFAAACAEAGLRFVGPPPGVIEAMGSKTAAKAIMEKAGVPVLPGVVVTPESAPAALARAAADIGYPLLVKAAFGGGGRGMRIVADADGLMDAVASAAREAASAFGDGTIFLERYVQAPRHIEVQIFADTHGNAVHLFERECSIQRRHQKIVEEAPSPAVDPVLRAELTAAAVTAAKAIGYVGAGTVEFILAPDRAFYFLEVNTRLQVEHPVTEAVTGLDLVRLQLLVAEGAPLPGDVAAAVAAGTQGHAIEARLYAEDVTAGFLPTGGTMHAFRIPPVAGVRVDSGIRDGGVVSPHYDPMLAKVIAHAPTRGEAARLLARALADAVVDGVVTNRDLLVGILREPEFLAGGTDTAYLERHDPAALVADGHNGALRLTASVTAAALADQARRRAEAPVLTRVPTGWRNVPSDLQRARYTVEGEDVEVGYRLSPRAGGWNAVVEIDGESVRDLDVVAMAPEQVVVTWKGVRRTFAVRSYEDEMYVASALGHARLRRLPRFPDIAEQADSGSLTAPMPGVVVRVLVSVGETVAAGQPVAVLEAMKMEHTLRSPADGVVTQLLVVEGAQVDDGAVLVVVDDGREDADTATASTTSTGPVTTPGSSS
ncbi:acetyl/propionyl/methylcrotonyl-CoA carboxylase subunit alpha [Yinghuangia sp. YIM S09857]|uniref:acetyl/propionyl/methylcrotonyl-CoA carboxylase subunit alpha n=1 Tax=Yinghuangia sp. YIM S09857 TaxID=3436929 RepID=UPI003F537665